MSILNITNLTDNPEQMIRDNFNSAFEELERDLGVSIDEAEKNDFIDNQIEFLEDQANNTMGEDLLGLIDNYLINLDYYSVAKEWYKNK